MNARIDPDEALWDKARGMLADELNQSGPQRSPAWLPEDERAYVEENAPAYAAALIREDEELEALYDEALLRLCLAFADAPPPAIILSHHLIYTAAPIVVHAALEARS
jgi:hypothetical protein